MFCASAPPPAGCASERAVTKAGARTYPGRASSTPLFRRLRLLLLTLEIGLHGREIRLLPAAFLIARLPVGHASMVEREPRARFCRREFDGDHGIRAGGGEPAGAPGLHDARAWRQLRRPAGDVAV